MTTSESDTGHDDNETSATEENARSADSQNKTEVMTTPGNEEGELTDGALCQKISIPQFTAADYMADPFFKAIYNYLRRDELTGDDTTDRKTFY